jgi:hypothetical protein
LWHNNGGKKWKESTKDMDLTRLLIGMYRLHGLHVIIMPVATANKMALHNQLILCEFPSQCNLLTMNRVTHHLKILSCFIHWFSALIGNWKSFVNRLLILHLYMLFVTVFPNCFTVSYQRNLDSKICTDHNNEFRSSISSFGWDGSP